MLQNVLVLSSWLSGSSSVVDFLERCGASICRPLTESDGNSSFNPYESADFRSMMAATIDETQLEFKSDRNIFKTTFKSWLGIEADKATKDNNQALVLHHPLSIFLIDEILAAGEFRIVVVTRPFKEIEESRIRENWEAFYGETGALAIYNQIYEQLHEKSLSYISISYDDFINSISAKWNLLDFCGIDLGEDQFENAFVKTVRLPSH
jgi:hypothetical protein